MKNTNCQVKLYVVLELFEFIDAFKFQHQDNSTKDMRNIHA